MYDSRLLIAFIALRANGWSLGSISLKIDVPKSTLWDWDAKHRHQIVRLQEHQLEKFHEWFMPTHEEELKTLTSHLNRLEEAIHDADFRKINPGHLINLALQVRGRLATLRRQATSHLSRPNAPIQPLPAPGRVTYNWEDQFSEEELADALAYNPGSESQPVNPKSQSQNRTNPDETPRGVENRALSINQLQKPPEDSRPVLQSQNLARPCPLNSVRSE